MNKRGGKLGNSNARRHGHVAGGKPSRTYMTWERMKQRCERHYASNFKYYGGRGIRLCPQWLRFETFLADMGEAPAGMTIDRIDANGDYSPQNCRWASAKQQNRNRRSNRHITHNGQTLCLAEWSERTGISARAIWGRLDRGWDVARTLTEGAK